MSEQINLDLPEGTIDAARLYALATLKKSHRQALKDLIIETLEPYRVKVDELLEDEYKKELEHNKKSIREV